MAITRRDFLKGLLALSGAAVVGLPEAEWAVAEAELLPQTVTARPRGRLGSIRIGDQWYALHDATITIDRFDIEQIFVPDPIGGFRPVAQLGGHVRSWEIDVEIDFQAQIDLDIPGPREFEIDAYRRFIGHGYITSEEVTYLHYHDVETVTRMLKIEGIEELRKL